MQYYDPQPEGVAWPKYGSGKLVEMRRALWKVAGDAAGQQCAQERLYRSRQPAEPVSASVRAAERAGGENLRQF